MSHLLTLPRVRRAGVALAAGAAFAALPAAAHASAVDLATAAPFVALGGSTVTNTGPSVLNGDLGVSPGTALVGFGLPATVNGATHANDAVAAQAQSDLTTAFGVAAGQPVTADLTGQDLGGKVLTAGAYRYATSAQLTGAVTFDAAGDPFAQFVVEIGSTLNTASASSVQLVNGASACNIFWQVGSSATLGTTTAFAGNILADQSISVDNGATIEGRALARIGAVTLNNDVLNRPQCATPATAAPGGSGGAGGGGGAPGQPGTGGTPGAPGTGTPGAQTPPSSRTKLPRRRGTAILRPGAPRARAACTSGFTARVRGNVIKRVVFTLGGKRIATRNGPTFRVRVRPDAGSRGTLRARVTFKDATRAKTMKFTYRACAAAALRPVLGPSQFTG